MKHIISPLVCTILAGCTCHPLMSNENFSANSQQYQKVIREATPNLRQTFNSQDGKEINYLCWAEQGRESFLFLNGLESHASWFDSLATDLVEQGYAVYALDRRGSGLNACLQGDYDAWINDVDNLVNQIHHNNPGIDINLTSLCFGARLATAYTIKHPNQINTLIYLSPGHKTKVDLNQLEKINLALSTLSGIDTPIQSPIESPAMFTSDPYMKDRIRNDDLRTSYPRASDFYQGYLLQELCDNKREHIETPSLVVLAGDDEIVDNQATKAFFRGFSRKPEIITYPKSDHIIFFNPVHRSRLVEDLNRFVNAH
ncbi:MAG: alpha/beta fold hydrolase [Candidatus Nanoarchaeia archaeon]